MTANVDLNAQTWYPIGYRAVFGGKFDGANKTISNATFTNTAYKGLGFFSTTLGATITNIDFTNLNISGRIMVGGVEGDSLDTAMSLVDYQSGSITTAQGYAGGWIGAAARSPDTNITPWIEKSAVRSSVTNSNSGKDYIGGMIGSIVRIKVKNCFNHASVVGGIGVGGAFGKLPAANR